MIEFNVKDLQKLKKVDGFILQDVHGQRVAIGKGFAYKNVFAFMNEYFKEYGANDFAKQIGYKDAIHMFKSWFSGIPSDESKFMSACLVEYGADNLAKKTGFEDASDMFKTWLSSIPFYESHFAGWVYKSFNGIHADSFKD